MSTPVRHFWTPQDLDFLRRNIGRKTHAEIAWRSSSP